MSDDISDSGGSDTPDDTSTDTGTDTGTDTSTDTGTECTDLGAGDSGTDETADDTTADDTTFEDSGTDGLECDNEAEPPKTEQDLENDDGDTKLDNGSQSGLNSDDLAEPKENPNEDAADDTDKKPDIEKEKPTPYRDDVLNNPENFDENGDLKWPQPDGFAGNSEKVTLNPGTKIDRYGDADGNFTASAGTPYEQRSLPYKENPDNFHTYEVMKPIDNVTQGSTAPAFGEPGGGTQQKYENNIQYYIDNDYLKEVK